MNLAGTKKFYDERWEAFGHANRFKLVRAAFILECLAAARLTDPTILDMGCGTGWLANILGMFGPAVGIDLSQKAVAAARKRFPHAEFFEADAIGWFPNRTFDVIVAHEVLEHFEIHGHFLAVVRRLLNDKGTLILTTPNARTLSAMEMEARTPDQPVENPLTAAELKALLAGDFETKRFTTAIGGFGSSGLWNRMLQNRLTHGAIDALCGAGAGESLVCPSRVRPPSRLDGSAALASVRYSVRFLAGGQLHACVA